MKKQLVILMSALLFVSCSKVSFEEIEQEQENSTENGFKNINFKLSGFTMSEINDLNEEDGGATRANTTQDKYTDNLLLGIFDMDGNIIDKIIYQSKSENSTTYGTFSKVLKYGKYQVLAIGWNGNQQCQVHRLDSITFSEEWTPHTFLCLKNIIVNESYSDTRTLSLKRCVSKFLLKFTDENIPQETRLFTVHFSNTGSSLNSQTGYCCTTNGFTRNIAVTVDPSKVETLASYCFLPQDSCGIAIDVVAFDEKGDTISQRVFQDVPMKINYTTTYTGNFFNFTSVEGTVDFETDYAGEFNKTF